MSRLLPVLLTGAVAAAAAAAAPTLATGASSGEPTRVGIDAEQQVSFSMTGRSVTVTVRPIDGAENPFVRDLWNTDVVLACRGTKPTSSKRSKGSKKSKKPKTRIAVDDLTWEDGASAQTFRLSRDVSRKPKWCVLERPQGTDLAVTFKLRVVKTTDELPETSPPAGK